MDTWENEALREEKVHNIMGVPSHRVASCRREEEKNDGCLMHNIIINALSSIMMKPNPNHLLLLSTNFQDARDLIIY